MIKQRYVPYLLVAWFVLFLAGCAPPQPQEVTGMELTREEANKALVRAFSDAENARNYEALDELMGEGFVRHSSATPGAKVTSREAFKSYLAANAAAFPDYTTSIEMMVAEGDKVAVYAFFRGTMEGPMGDFPATGNSAEMPFLGIFRIEEGQIAELWVEWDNVAFLSELGLFPPPGAGA